MTSLAFVRQATLLSALRFGQKLNSWAACSRGGILTNATAVIYICCLSGRQHNARQDFMTALKNKFTCRIKTLTPERAASLMPDVWHESVQLHCLRITFSHILVFASAGTPYASSKAAMNQLTRNWGCEWAPDGIRVNAVAPWYTKTPLTEPVQADASR